ncbi:20452_t:CDS:2 [Dentiscutata erythropus]|uniref:20452_t:CDS:1 n=1 Tax=Dentiscutata erythropus TaxID=1348616 RepID=A0A9N9CEF8_9GLOM|nr:20452_t:CDS:2 [Dentiscutata erythropus]
MKTQKIIFFSNSVDYSVPDSFSQIFGYAFSEENIRETINGINSKISSNKSGGVIARFKAYGSPINIMDIKCYERFKTVNENLWGNENRWNFSQRWREPDQIILNITSNSTSSPNEFFYNYFGIVFHEVEIKCPRFDWARFSHNMSPIPRGHLVILEFSIMIKKSYESRHPSDIETKKSHYPFVVEKLKVNTMLSDIGGLYAAIAAIIALFLGSPRHSPWYGWCQTFMCWGSFRRNFKRHFASCYISRAGIPLIDDPRNLPPGATIEHRMAILENLLKEYYLDASFLEVITNTRNKYIFYDKEYKKIETESNEDLDTDERDDSEYRALIESNNDDLNEIV